MDKIETLPKVLEVEGSKYELEICTEGDYISITYEHIPRKEDFFISTIAKNLFDAKAKMVGLLEQEGLI